MRCPSKSAAQPPRNRARETRSSLTRMVDFERWVCAGLGDKEAERFRQAYQDIRGQTSGNLMEDPLVEALQHLRPNNKGTAIELLDQLNQIPPAEVRGSPSWPRQPNRLTARLKMLPVLRQSGIKVEF
jgi:hypothetical protein